MKQTTYDGRRGGRKNTKFATRIAAPRPGATRVLPTRPRHAALARLEPRPFEDAGIFAEPASASRQTLAEDLGTANAACDSNVLEYGRAAQAAESPVQSRGAARSRVERDSLAANCNREIDAWARQALAANGFGDAA
jgi:hypothetical protein